MDLKQFYFYIAIAEECNLSRAAEKLFISQSALSRFLLKLENTLNVRLFLRAKNNSLIITEAGKELLDCYRKVVRELETCANHISGQSKGEKKSIVCGVTGELGLRKITGVLSKFMRLHPETKVEFIHLPIRRLMELLCNGEIDIVRSVYDEKDPSMSYIPIYRDPISLFVSPDHPLAQRRQGSAATSEAVSLSELTDVPFVLLADGTTQRKVIQRYFDQINFSPKSCIEVSTSLSALSVIEEGLAVGLVQKEYSVNARVCALKIDPPLYYDVGFIYQKINY